MSVLDQVIPCPVSVLVEPDLRYHHWHAQLVSTRTQYRNLQVAPIGLMSGLEPAASQHSVQDTPDMIACMV